MCVCVFVSKDSSEESRRRQEEENKAYVSQTPPSPRQTVWEQRVRAVHGMGPMRFC